MEVAVNGGSDGREAATSAVILATSTTEGEAEKRMYMLLGTALV
jgi:hypothetical protein